MPDGVFAPSGPGALSFFLLPAPTDGQVHQLLLRIATRIESLVALQDEDDDPDEQHRAVAATLIAASDTGLTTGQSRLPGGLWVEPAPKPRCAAIDGYSLHANVSVSANDRPGLARLLRYGARPVLCQHRLCLTPTGLVRYRLRKPGYGGRTHIDMSPEDFVRRLAALIPPPWLNLTRFHGVFAAAHAARKLLAPLVRAPPGDDPDDTESTGAAAGTAAGPLASAVPVLLDPLPAPVRIAWSELLHRSFALDVLACPRCHGGRMRLVATIKDKTVIDKILCHLELPTDPPPTAPARAPPQLELDGYL